MIAVGLASGAPVHSRRQLYEVMVGFWTDHFNIDSSKSDCRWFKTVDDRSVIRPHALGDFQDRLLRGHHVPVAVGVVFGFGALGLALLHTGSFLPAPVLARGRVLAALGLPSPR